MLEHFETRWEKITFLGFCTCFAAVVAITAASVALQVGRPSPGFVIWQNLVVPAIGTPGWPGIQAGIPLRSSLVAVDNVPVRRANEVQAIVRRLPVGTPVRYSFARAGARETFTIPTVRLGWRHVLPAYSAYVLAGLAFLGTALTVFYIRSHQPAARAGLALGTTLGLVCILALDVLSAAWLQRLYFCCESLMPAALLHFALAFPEEKDALRRHPRLLWVVYAAFLPLAFAQNVLITGDPALHLRINGWTYTATAAAGLLLIVSLVHTYVRSANPLARQQAKVVLAGGIFAAALPSLGLLSITLLEQEIPINFLAPFFLVYPLSIGYAIVRHDLFGVDRFLRLGVVYVALTIVIFLAYTGVVLGVQSWLGAEERLPRSVVPMYLVVVLLVFDPLRSRIQVLVDRLFYRQAYSYRRTVEATSRALASVLNTEEIARTVLETLTGVMAIEWAVIMLLGDEDNEQHAYGSPYAHAHAVAAAFAPGDPALAAAAMSDRPLHKYVDPPAKSRTSFEPFAALGATLVLPIRFRRRALGVAVLGEKRSGAFYSDGDLELFDTLINQAALAFTNAHAYEVIARTQRDLVDAERLAAVGELASAVAHGIRNPLAGIRASAQVAREDLDPGDARADLGESLDDIVAETNRLEQRVRSILDIARPLNLRLVEQDLNACLQACAEGARARLPQTVRLSVDLDPSLPAVPFDPVRITEVLETIVVNAVEAMDGDGRIAIRSRLDQSNAVDTAAVVSVSDTGPGMDVETQIRVFDLFYTTKPSGTGVGLAMAKRLIERQGGTLTLISAPGEGATFDIRIPIRTGVRPTTV